jgi:peptidoglycan/LPS O-acetylase OafA/YrhL
MRIGSRLRSRRHGGRALRLSDAIEQGRAANNFDLLRLLGAGLVLFAHSFALSGDGPAPAPGWLDDDWGGIGVVIFFSISGFLIARSWAYDPKPLSFAMKRALRLVPALIVSLLLTALVLGPVATSLPLADYLENPGTKAYVLDNATFQTNFTLPGVFADVPFPNAVNGSLWTLALEVKAYCLVVVLGLLGLFGRRRLLMPVVAVAIALMAVVSIRNAVPFGDRFVAMLADIQAPPGIVAAARGAAFQGASEVFASFAIGASLFAVARWISLRWSIGIALVGAWALAGLLAGTNARPIALAWLLPYVVLLLAYRTTHLVRLPARFGDYSYGVYIFAFPVQQAVAQWLRPSSGWTMFVLATPVVLLLAVASWHLVEAPSLTLKQRLWRPLERASAAAAHPLDRLALQPAPAFSGEDSEHSDDSRVHVGERVTPGP